MVIFLHGPDTYRSKQKIEELKEKFIREVDKSALNIAKIDGEKLSLNKFKETVLVPGFLARRRMIIIENICQNKDLQLQTAVMKFLEKQDNKAENIVIFWEDGSTKYEKDTKIRKNNKLFNKLKQQKYVQEFVLLKGYKLNEWIKKEVIKKGGKIEDQAVDLLASFVGSDLWQMSNEINKLVSYKQNKIIFSDDIDLLVKSKIDENIFNLVNALGTKNKKLALKLLNDQLESKISWAYLMAMIIWQFRILLQIKFLNLRAGVRRLPAEKEAQSLPPQSALSEALTFGLHPYVLQKAQIQAKNYSLEELKKIYQRLLKIDLQLKTSQIDPKVLFDLFIVNV